MTTPTPSLREALEIGLSAVKGYKIDAATDQDLEMQKNWKKSSVKKIEAALSALLHPQPPAPGLREAVAKEIGAAVQIFLSVDDVTVNELAEGAADRILSLVGPGKGDEARPMKLEADIDPTRQPGEAHIRVYQIRKTKDGHNRSQAGFFYCNSTEVNEEIAYRINAFEREESEKGEPVGSRPGADAPTEPPMSVLEVLHGIGAINSFGEGRRLIGQRAVFLDGVGIVAHDTKVSSDNETIRVGKRTYQVPHVSEIRKAEPPATPAEASEAEQSCITHTWVAVDFEKGPVECTKCGIRAPWSRQDTQEGR